VAKPELKRMTLKQRRNLLNVVADFIEPLPKKKFDMNKFGVHPAWDEIAKKYDEDKFHVPGMHSCNTAGCALGWAVSIPAVVAAGFGPKDYNDANDEGDHEAVISLAASVFAIRPDVAATIFGPGQKGHRTPDEVARNLRKVAATGELPRGMKDNTDWLW
jgi:hypothetical protein